MAGEASGAASCLVREVVVQVRRGGVAGEADGGGTARGGRRVRRAARRRERRAARRGEGGTAGGAVVEFSDFWVHVTLFFGVRCVVSL